MGDQEPAVLMCAYCGEGIMATGLDPCAVVLIGHWNDPAVEQQEQQFFCHARCQLGVMHPEAAELAAVISSGDAAEHQGGFNA